MTMPESEYDELQELADRLDAIDSQLTEIVGIMGVIGVNIEDNQQALLDKMEEIAGRTPYYGSYS